MNGSDVPNQNPEQLARDRIDDRLRAAGWQVQDKGAIDFEAGPGIAVREYQTDVGPADYVLFSDRRAVGVVEAKPDTWGVRLTSVEEQSEGYANARLKWVTNAEPLPFVYESTGLVTRFTNARDPHPRSREVFTFPRPETLKRWTQAGQSLRAGIAALPVLNPEGLRDCQVTAIENLETSLRGDRPRALIQMATGSGKTFTAITEIYRLLKHAGARRILFLVDTRNLGEQAEQEFMAFVPNDDNRKFTELYNVQRLATPSISADSQVVISTIQRMYATLKGEALDEGADDENPAERQWRRKEPLPVVYSAKLPPEHFDVVVIDECHRSIYNLWRQVIEYFDAYLIGLTATPDNRTYGFFQKNVVSEYTHERAVADKVNVGNEIVAGTRRLCLMNMFLHGIGEMTGESLISPADSLISPPSETFDYVLANPPFGKKSSMSFTNDDGEQETDELTYNRQDFWATTSNKQLNFVQHIRAMLKTTGRAAIVVPDNVLFEGGAGETIRRKLLRTTDLHTILRLPTGIFYAQGVKANVFFLDNRAASPDPRTSKVWYYDYRTNVHHTLKQKPLTYAHLEDFVACYGRADRNEREPTWSEETPDGRWRAYDREELLARDKASLDVFWLRDASMTDLDNLPEPEILASEIVENLQSALAQFAAVASALEGRSR